MLDITRLRKAEFTQLCQQLLAGLGMARAKSFEARGVEYALRYTIVRESTDKMFRTDETWLCVFVRPSGSLKTRQAQAIAEATVAADVRFLLVVVFATVSFDVEGQLRRTLAEQGVHVALLAGPLAECLPGDFVQWTHSVTAPDDFSFARLRHYAQGQVATAPWRHHFQTASLQPGRVLPLQAEDEVLSESDLVRVLHGGSFLLLGEPGAGKTTSLLALARELAETGPLTPVFVPLGRYRGDFWEVLCEALAPGATPVSKTMAEVLVESGGLVLLLDGINEVQSTDLQARLVNELNRLTAPDEPSAQSRWIVSGRVHDYQQGHRHLVYLESRRWEMQPFTADLIYRLLADSLGEAEGLACYQELSEAVRDLCTNPLLLNMVLTVYKQQGRAPVSRGALYRQFVDLLLQWGDDRHLLTDQREAFARLWPEPFTEETYRTLARSALTALASSDSFTHIAWREAQRQCTAVLAHAQRPEQAAAILLEDLSHRGVLRYDVANRISFFHHTMQEYFYALQLTDRPVEELIPPTGAVAARREAVIFLAGLLADPTPLVERALAIDPFLAFEIVRDAPEAIPAKLTCELAQKLWSNATTPGGVTGANRRWALLFKRLAVLLKKTVETLALNVASYKS